MVPTPKPEKLSEQKKMNFDIEGIMKNPNANLKRYALEYSSKKRVAALHHSITHGNTQMPLYTGQRQKLRLDELSSLGNPI